MQSIGDFLWLSLCRGIPFGNAQCSFFRHTPTPVPALSGSQVSEDGFFSPFSLPNFSLLSPPATPPFFLLFLGNILQVLLKRKAQCLVLAMQS